MNSSICGIECSKCPFVSSCKGCSKENTCILVKCCLKNKYTKCLECKEICKLKKELIKEFRELGIEELKNLADLNALKGSYVNLEYTLSNGNTIKLLEDSKIYLGNQIENLNDKDKCYGIVGDEDYILVSEYEVNGVNPKIILYKKR